MENRQKSLPSRFCYFIGIRFNQSSYHIDSESFFFFSFIATMYVFFCLGGFLASFVILVGRPGLFLFSIRLPCLFCAFYRASRPVFCFPLGIQASFATSVGCPFLFCDFHQVTLPLFYPPLMSMPLLCYPFRWLPHPGLF